MQLQLSLAHLRYTFEGKQPEEESKITKETRVARGCLLVCLKATKTDGVNLETLDECEQLLKIHHINESHLTQSNC